MREKSGPSRQSAKALDQSRPTSFAETVGSLVDASPLPMVATIGTDHLVGHANPAFCRLVGREREVIVGRPLTAALPRARRRRTQDLLDRVAATGRSERTGNLGLAGDAPSSAPWEAVTWPVAGDGLRPPGLLMQLSASLDPLRAQDSDTDIASQLREANRRLLLAGIEAQRHADDESTINAELRTSTQALRASERRYSGRAAELEATIEAFEDGVAVLDGKGDVIVMNVALARTIGHSVATEAAMRQALSGAELQPGAEPTRLQLRRDGRWIEVRTFSAGDVHPDDVPSRVVVIRDVSQERAEMDAREAFVGVLSHELRTPITTILGMALLLSRSTIEHDTTTRRELIGDIAAEAVRLDRLIEDLLVLSRSERSQLVVDPEPVLVQHVIREAVTAEAGRFPLVTFVADIPPLPPVLADRTYVTQILRNLLSNAGKYGPDGAAVVQVVAEREGDNLNVRVLDQGTSFPVADQERLFDLFFRASHPARLQPGSGIGLYVTRLLVEAMHGRVWASERDGGGSVFGFTLPILAVGEPDN